MSKKVSGRRINIFEAIWDKIVDDVSIMIIIFGGIAFFVWLNCIVIGFICTFFSFLSNGFEAFNLLSNLLIELWLNYKLFIVSTIILALAFIVRVINLEIDWGHFKKEIF